MRTSRAAAAVWTGLCVALSAWSADIYVSAAKGAGGAAGTQDAPLKSINEALSKAAPGDHIRVQEGTYGETVTLSKSGEEGKPIALTGEGKVILKPSNGHGIVGRNVGWWVVTGFESVNHNQGIKFKDSHDIAIRKCSAHDGSIGLAFEGATAKKFLFEDVDLYNNQRSGMDVNNGVTLEDTIFRRVKAYRNRCDGGNDGLGISHEAITKNVRFEKCEAYENGSDGFDLSGRKGFGVTCVDCIAHHNGQAMWGANFKCWNPGSVFINCVAWESIKNADGNFEAAGDNITFINCTSGANRDSGFIFSAQNAKVINCIIAGAAKNSYKIYTSKDKPAPTFTFENCLIFNCGNAKIDSLVRTPF
jgi:hypothetical protein